MNTPEKNVMDTMHVWIGIASISKDKFNQYFAINPVDRDAGVGASQFDKDLGTGWYDDDLIGVYYSSGTDELEAALDELPATPQALTEIETRCAEVDMRWSSYAGQFRALN